MDQTSWIKAKPRTGLSKAGGTNVESELDSTETEDKQSSVIMPVHAAPKDTRDPALSKDTEFYVRFSKDSLLREQILLQLRYLG